MFDLRTDDTIAAISTPPGAGGIGIIRLSGPRARSIAAKIFVPQTGKRFAFPERRAVLGTIRDPGTREVLDEGFLLFFRAPKSYTRQDVVEISLHGSPAVLDEAIRLAVRAGARLAHSGEFTLRAYWNGRIDILQAEAVDDLVRSVSLTQARMASRQLRGSLTGTIRNLRAEFIEVMADLEASIEFPDEKLDLSDGAVRGRLESIALRLERLVQSYDAGKALSEGLTLAIVGRANVGKSTLFNALLGETRAIVTPDAGTTRDYLCEKLRIGETVFKLVDMAGLGRPGTAVEKEGIRRGREQAAEADGILFLFDRSRPETAGDAALLHLCGQKKAILVFNKNDRPRKIRAGRLRRLAPDSPALDISALTGAGLAALRQLVHDVFAAPNPEAGDVILHLRQKTVLQEIALCVRAGLESLDRGSSTEFVAEELRLALPAVGRLLGEIRSDEVIENIFSRFCVGK